MREENKRASKNKWSQMFKKKWFFPAVYMTVAALLLTAVVWYQNIGNQLPDAKKGDDAATNLHDEEAQSVMEQQETIQMPIADEAQAEIVTKFYNYDADEKSQKDGIILYNNRYYQSTGLGIGMADGETFDVVASLSGKVAEIKEDPLLGNVVIMEHANDVSTYYASLGEIKAKEGDELKQGDTIGAAGKNLFMKDNGTHVHFELRKNNIKVDPEQYFNQPLSKLDDVEAKQAESEEKAKQSESTEKAEDKSLEKSEEKTEDKSLEQTDTQEQEDGKQEEKTEDSSEEEQTPAPKAEETKEG